MKCYSGDEVIKISKNVEKEGYESKVFEDIDMEDQKDTEEDTTSKKGLNGFFLFPLFYRPAIWSSSLFAQI